MNCRQTTLRHAGKPVNAQLKIPLDPVANGKGQKEGNGHDYQKDGDTPHFAGEQLVRPLGEQILPFLVEQDFTDDFPDEVIFLVDDVRLVAAIQHLGKVHRVLLRDLLILLQQLQRMPAVVRQTWITTLQLRHDLVDLVLDLIGIDHGIL